MRILSRTVAFAVLGALLSLPVLGADDKDKKGDAKKEDAVKADVKKDDAKKDDAPKKGADKKTPATKLPTPKKGGLKNLDRDPDAAEAKIMKSGVVRGRVMAVIEDKKTIRLQLTIPYMKINTGAVQNYMNAQRSLMQARNPQGVINAQRQMAQAEAQIYQIATVQKDVEWQATDDVKVRRAEPPPQFDDKGRIKRYTRKELKELKGDDKQPGYPAEFSDIKQEQIVEVTLVRKKDAARGPIRKGKDADPEVVSDKLPRMSFIVIVAEPRN